MAKIEDGNFKDVGLSAPTSFEDFMYRLPGFMRQYGELTAEPLATQLRSIGIDPDKYAVKIDLTQYMLVPHATIERA